MPIMVKKSVAPEESGRSTLNKAVLSPSAGTAITLALHASPKPRRYVAQESLKL